MLPSRMAPEGKQERSRGGQRGVGHGIELLDLSDTAALGHGVRGTAPELTLGIWTGSCAAHYHFAASA